MIEIITTTPQIEGARILRYHGPVVGQAILGANAMRDWFARLRDIWGGRAVAYEKVFDAGRKIALVDMAKNATDTGANAIVGMTFDYETLGVKGGILMVVVCGTAVTAEPVRRS